MRLKAPFPWFGGKSTVARSVWLRIGDVSNFIEPFSGSAAMLLARPHPPRIETLNDFDCYVANFWRATLRDPEAVVEFADGPVNEADLHARHRWLVYSEHAAEWRLQMRRDPDHFDAKIAGWWCWGLCQWIGSGWCDNGADWNQIPADRQTLTGIHGGQAPSLRGDSGAAGTGIHASAGGKRLREKRPMAAGDRSDGRGVHVVHQKRPRSHREASSGEGGTMPGIHGGPSQKLPRMTGARKGDEYYGGLGVHMEQIPDGRPQLADAYDIGRGVHSHGDIGTCENRRLWLLDWFGRLRDRLRNVRVCCGDWERVCGSPSVTTRLGTTGIFLDPPYAKSCERMQQWAAHLRGDGPEPAAAGKSTNRSGDLYATDGHDVDHLVARVLNYCRERGADPSMRIALAGYDGEHNELEAHGWQPLAWKANGGYANRRGGGANENAGRERIWFSPHCLAEVPEDSDVRQMGLFV